MSFSPDSRYEKWRGFHPESQQSSLPKAEELGSNWWEVAYNQLLTVFKSNPDMLPVTKVSQLDRCRTALKTEVLQVHVSPFPPKERTANTDPAWVLTHTIEVAEEDLSSTRSDKDQEKMLFSELVLPIQKALGEFVSRIDLKNIRGRWIISLDLNTSRIRREIHHQPSHRQLWSAPAAAHVVIGRNPQLVNPEANQVGVQLDGVEGLSRMHLEAWFDTSAGPTQKPALLVRDLGSANGTFLLYPDETDYDAVKMLFENSAEVHSRRIPQLATFVEPLKTLCMVGPSIVRSVPIIVKLYLKQGQIVVESYRLDPPAIVAERPSRSPIKRF